MFEKLSGNLNQLMTEIPISADELARRTGIPSSTIKKIRNSDNPNPTLSTLLPLSQFFQITLGQLVGDEPIPSERIKGVYQTPAAALYSVPLIFWHHAINWPSITEPPAKMITTEFSYSRHVFALCVEESDWENLSKGTILIIDPAIKPIHRDFIIVYKSQQQIPTLKQALFDEDQLYLKSVVASYQIAPHTQEHQILGVVVEYKKHLRTSL